MSKVLVICYKNGISHTEEEVRKSFAHIEPENIINDLIIIQPDSTRNIFVGVLNAEFEFTAKTEAIISGYKRPIESKNEKLADGSYFQINWDTENISFNVDRFESKSLWYYQDDEKFILSNSQLLIVSLKKSFTINRKAVSWFLSSGSTGFQNAWDIDVKKVLQSYQYVFSLNDWDLSKTKEQYAVEQLSFSNKNEFLKKYTDFTRDTFINLAKNYSVKKMVMPLSGGNDSRLLFYIAHQLKYYKELALANWGVKKENDQFDDKVAAKEIAYSYKKSLKDYYLPSKIDDLNRFFEAYIRNGDCRIDHFNAYSDRFKIFEQLFNEDYKFLIRGDIPFTEGLDLNDKMSRAHIGILKWTDYANYKNFVLDDFVAIQEEDSPVISKNREESLIEWRDRLYIDFRMPIVISAFDDLINSYLVTIAPMMSYSHYLLYCQQKPHMRGDKAHIVEISKKMDQSEVGFNATTSLLSMEELLETDNNIKYLKDSLVNLENTLFSREMIDSVCQKLKYYEKENINHRKSFKSRLVEITKENLPIQLKSLLKSKIPHNISNLTIAYRITMVDKVCKIFNEATL